MEPILSKYLHAKGKKLGLPIAGTFELTPRCNFNCKMCYVHLTEAEQKRRGRELSADEWLTLAEQAKRAGTVFLLLTGGEPTLRPDFPLIYREIQKMGFVLSINSNGYLLQGELRELLLQAPPVRVSISLYGANNEAYERLCGVPAYDRVVENIRALREAGVDVRVTMSMTPANCAELSGVLREAERVGANAVAVSYMFPPLRAHPERVGENFRFTPEEAGRFSAEFQRLTLERGAFCRRADALCAGTAEQEDDCGLSAEGEGITCRAGVTSFWMTWDGRMLPCGQMPEPSIVLPAGGFAEAWELLRERTAQIRLPAKCVSCAERKVCQVCAAKCRCETGRFDGVPEYICRMGKAYLEAMCAERMKIREDSNGDQT